MKDNLNSDDRSWIEINLTNFEYNISQIKKYIPKNYKFMQIVKADAYGHGAIEIAKKSIELGASFLGVANAEEGKLLRYNNIQIPILILSPSFENELETIINNKLTPTISTIEFAQKLNQYSQKQNTITNIHINFDTGMGRSGFHYKSFITDYEKIKKLKNLNIEGVFSHFSASENNYEYTKLQSDRFKKILDNFKIIPKFIHISNSSGIINIQTKYSNLVRVGLLSYGIYSDKTLKTKVNLKPVMTFKSKISQIKIAQKNESIGYNQTYITDKKMKYAILPIGYADGYDYLLSNKGKVFINKKLCDVIGKVSMDMIAIDISELPNVAVGNQATLFGGKNNKMRVENITSFYGGSSYELVCQIGRRAKRYYYENGKNISISPLMRREFVSSDYSGEQINLIIKKSIEQRFHKKEISKMIYSNILKNYLNEINENIYYRKKFVHKISFEESDKKALKAYYKVHTYLTFDKILENDYFYIACAKNEKLLQKYFNRNDVEYRWLLDSKFDLDKYVFSVKNVKINDIQLKHKQIINNNCLEIKCSNLQLKKLIGSEVKFSIETITYYPKSYHQLAIYITGFTQGATIQFDFDKLFQKVTSVPMFYNKNKNVKIRNSDNSVTVSLNKNQWILPNSAVVFVY
ncbi:MAG: alanine racemase [Candidatus Marinimicrobia bacterium]|nr:alanine racemase [Candidatus Neomarinimicrobiota bacterium]